MHMRDARRGRHRYVPRMLMLGVLAVVGLWWAGPAGAAEAVAADAAAPTGDEAAGAPAEEAEATGYGAAGLQIEVAPAELQHDWRLMVHYFKIARFDLAAQHAEKVLTANPDPATVLALVESATTGYDLVIRMLQVDAMEEVAPKILALAEEGARAKKTDTARIQENLLKLDKGPRPYFLAMKELRYSGPYVVPHALAILQDPGRKDLHPFVQRALTELGTPVVRPLVRALATPNANLKEMTIGILGDIGHPNALPALKAVVEHPDSTEGSKGAASNAIIKIADESMLQTPAKRLYLDLANKYYYDKIPVADVHQPTTDVFDWVKDTGLLYRAAPSKAVNEILASRACSDALKADPGALAAVALWVSSVMQMEAELEGQKAREADPFLPDDMPSVDFFARAVGQQHLYSVLDRALRDENTPVAVRACRALEDTANEEFLNLYAESKAGSPLVLALTYPDQRVRFAAAFALAAIRPTEPFTGAGKVIPTLSEALNLEAAKSILLVEPKDDNRNRLQAELKNEEWNVVTATTGNDAISKARAMPRVDAVVLSSKTQHVGHADVVSMLRSDYHTAMTPIVVLSWPDDPVKASWLEQRVPYIQAVDHNIETAALLEQVTALKKEAGSLVLDEEAARATSLEAAEVLKRIALSSRLYSAKRARQSLLDSLSNRPDALVISVLGALAEIADAEITRAMGDVAVNAERSKPVRVAALLNLARAARIVGNELTEAQIAALQTMAGETDDDLRDAAGEALGALDLDAAEGAKVILQHGAH
jgi:CheY-like chemotaxis protein